MSDKMVQLSALFQFQMGRSQHFELSDPRSLVAFVTSGNILRRWQAAVDTICPYFEFVIGLHVILKYKAKNLKNVACCEEIFCHSKSAEVR